MIPRTHRYTRTDTLFPNTTLFRSVRVRQFAGISVGRADLEGLHRPLGQVWDAVGPLDEAQHHVGPLLEVDQRIRTGFRARVDHTGAAGEGTDLQDRKSTRLNSSH